MSRVQRGHRASDQAHEERRPTGALRPFGWPSACGWNARESHEGHAGLRLGDRRRVKKVLRPLACYVIHTPEDGPSPCGGGPKQRGWP